MFPAAIQSFVRRIRSIRERNDWRSIARKAVDAGMRIVLRTEVSRVIWLDAASTADVAPDPDFEFRFLSADEVAQHAQDPSYYLDEKLAERIRGGRDFCFAALQGDRLASFAWFALDAIEPEHADGVAISYPSDVAFLYFGFTHPEFRGARLHGQVMDLGLRELSACGVTKLLSIVGWSNVSSLKSCRRLGFRDLGRMIAIGSRKRAFGFYPAKAKALDVRFGRHAAKRPATSRPPSGPAVESAV